jgi:hypothetical protein
VGAAIEGVAGRPVPFGHSQNFFMSFVFGYTRLYSWQSISPI